MTCCLFSGVDSAINEAIKSSIDGDQDNTNTVKYRVARSVLFRVARSVVYRVAR